MDSPIIPPSQRPLHVPNYLVQSILATLFCCLPFGIVSIVFAAQVNGKLQAGDYAGAVQASKTAKMWCWVAFGVGLVVIIGYTAFLMLFGVAAALHPAVTSPHP